VYNIIDGWIILIVFSRWVYSVSGESMCAVFIFIFLTRSHWSSINSDDPKEKLILCSLFHHKEVKRYLFKWEIMNLSSIILLFIISESYVRHAETHVINLTKPKGTQSQPIALREKLSDARPKSRGHQNPHARNQTKPKGNQRKPKGHQRKPKGTQSQPIALREKLSEARAKSKGHQYPHVRHKKKPKEHWHHHE